MNRKGFTLIELLVVLTILFVAITGIIIVVGCIVSACSGPDTDDLMVSNPPIFANGEIAQMVLDKKKVIVVNRALSWNKDKQNWNIKIKDGGKLDVIGGYIVNESELEKSEVDKKTIGR
jgi:prepilin-type N-terminal cleavage/methylation domain-containing protein